MPLYGGIDLHANNSVIVLLNLLGQIPRSLLRLSLGCYGRLHERLSA